MMNKEQVIAWVLSDEFYNGKETEAMNKYGVKATREITNLINELICYQKPEFTAMISIYSNSVQYPKVQRVHLPLEDVKHNEKWFAAANLLCELLCGEKIWDKSRFIIEQDAATSDEWKKTELFEKRFAQMIAQLIKKHPENEKMFTEFKDKVDYLKNAITRYECGKSIEESAVMMGFIGMNEEEICSVLKNKKDDSDWEKYAKQEAFYHVSDVFGRTRIADTLGNNQIGFWMELSLLCCL